MEPAGDHGACSRGKLPAQPVCARNGLNRKAGCSIRHHAARFACSWARLMRPLSEHSDCSRKIYHDSPVFRAQMQSLGRRTPVARVREYI